MARTKQQTSYRPTFARRDEENDDVLFNENSKIQDVQDNIDVMKACLQQETDYQSEDYLSFLSEVEDEESATTTKSSSIDEVCRQKMVEWCFKVVDYFDLPRRNVFVAMSCVDRFLSTELGKEFLLDKKAYQLLCITCLHTTVKVHEPVEIALSSLITLCKGLYTEMQLKNMEQIVLSTIDWKMNPPVSRDYVTCFTMLLEGVHTSLRREVYHMACYLTESALCHYATGAIFSPFDAAMGSFITALSLYPDEISRTQRRGFFKTLREHSIYVCNLDDVDQAITVLESNTSLRQKTTRARRVSTENDDITGNSCSDQQMSSYHGDNKNNKRSNRVVASFGSGKKQQIKGLARSTSPVAVSSAASEH